MDKKGMAEALNKANEIARAEEEARQARKAEEPAKAEAAREFSRRQVKAARRITGILDGAGEDKTGIEAEGTRRSVLIRLGELEVEDPHGRTYGFARVELIPKMYFQRVKKGYLRYEYRNLPDPDGEVFSIGVDLFAGTPDAADIIKVGEFHSDSIGQHQRNAGDNDIAILAHNAPNEHALTQLDEIESSLAVIETHVYSVAATVTPE